MPVAQSVLIRTLLGGAAIALVSATESQSAQIDILETVDGPQIVMIAGQIEDGDDMAFVAKTDGIEEAIVLLRGPGGAPVTAMNIGAVISERGYDTAIVPFAECSSGCALAWLAGQERFMAPTARVNLTIDSAATEAAPSLPALQNLVRSYLRDTSINEANRGVTYSRDGAVPDLWLDRAAVMDIGIEVTISEQEQTLAAERSSAPDPAPIETVETTPEPEQVAEVAPGAAPEEVQVGAPEVASETAEPATPEIVVAANPEPQGSDTSEAVEPKAQPLAEVETVESEEPSTDPEPTPEPEPESISEVETASSEAARQPDSSEVVEVAEEPSESEAVSEDDTEQVILALPPDQRWIVLASSRDETALTRDSFANLPDDQRFLRVRTKNGMFAAAIGPFPNADITQTRNQLIQQGAIPRDSYISTGGGFVEKVD